MLRALTLMLGLLVPALAGAVDWPDTPLARTEALALLQTLNADLLSHPSATLTLEHWCGSHRLAAVAKVVARRDRKTNKPLPEDLRRALGIDAGTPVRYRRVQLTCGDHVLSEADNWYLPARLSAAMNRTLDHSDSPFGKVVAPLHFRGAGRCPGPALQRAGGNLHRAGARVPAACRAAVAAAGRGICDRPRLSSPAWLPSPQTT